MWNPGTAQENHCLGVAIYVFDLFVGMMVHKRFMGVALTYLNVMTTRRRRRMFMLILSPKLLAQVAGGFSGLFRVVGGSNATHGSIIAQGARVGTISCH